jgi:hypothetical protein
MQQQAVGCQHRVMKLKPALLAKYHLEVLHGVAQ